MRLLKMVCTAMLTALAAISFIASSPAIASEDGEVVVCAELVELCSEKLLPQGAVLKGSSKSTTFLGTVNEKCGNSSQEIEIATTGGMAESLLVGVLSWTVQECKPCTTVTFKGGELHIQKILGLVRWKSRFLGVKWVFTGCPFGVSCTFQGEVELESVNTSMGLEMVAEKEPLPLVAGSAFFCGNVANWDGSYLYEGHWLSSYEL